MLKKVHPAKIELFLCLAQDCLQGTFCMGIMNAVSASPLRSDDSMINQIDQDYQEAAYHVIDVTFAL